MNAPYGVLGKALLFSKMFKTQIFTLAIAFSTHAKEQQQT
jgi:hypothetical protein